MISKDAWVQEGSRLEAPVHISANASVYGNTTIGHFTFLNVGTVLYPQVNMGRFCSTGRWVEIGAAQHPTDSLSTHLFQFGASPFDELKPEHKFGRKHQMHKPTEIGHDVWIGAKAIISTGVKIGHGAIVAAGSVVTKDVEPYAIVGGVPAKTIRMRFSEDIVERLLQTQWWDRSVAEITTLKFWPIEKVLSQLDEFPEPPST